MEYTCIYRKETKMNVGERVKAKKTCKGSASAEGEGKGMGDRRKKVVK